MQSRPHPLSAFYGTGIEIGFTALPAHNIVRGVLKARPVVSGKEIVRTEWIWGILHPAGK